MFLGNAVANPDATASVSIVLPAKPCLAAGVQASVCAQERSGPARGGAACSASARTAFQPYQAVLCLDSTGAPVDHFCPQPRAVQDAAAASHRAECAETGDAARARSDDEALNQLVQICRLLRSVPGESASAYAVPQKVLRELPVSLVRAAERSVRQRCARLCFQEFNEYQRAQALSVLVPPATSPPAAAASPEGALVPPACMSPAAPAAPAADLGAVILAAAEPDDGPVLGSVLAAGAAADSPIAEVLGEGPGDETDPAVCVQSEDGGDDGAWLSVAGTRALP